MTSRSQKLFIWTWSLPQLGLLVLIFLARAPILSWSPLQLGFTWSPYWIGLVLAWCSRVYIGLLSEAKKVSSAFLMPYSATLPELLPECLPESYPSALSDHFTHVVTWVLTRVLHERLTRSGYSYPISLPSRLTPDRLCPGTLYPSR
jgi:hypothetical protein